MQELIKLWCKQYNIIYHFDFLTGTHYFNRIYEVEGLTKGNLFSISNGVFENINFRDVDVVLNRILEVLKIEEETTC